MLDGALVLLSLERADVCQAVFNGLDDAGLLVLGGKKLFVVSADSTGVTISMISLTLYGKKP